MPNLRRSVGADPVIGSSLKDSLFCCNQSLAGCLREQIPYGKLPKEPPESTWPIRSQYGRTFFVFPPILVNTYKTLSFSVPVCKTCKMQLTRDSTRWYRIFTISGLFVGVLFCAMLCAGMGQNSGALLVVGILALTCVIIAYTKREKYWSGSGIGSYDGRYFTYKNKEFQQEFAKLNPTLVRKV